MHLHLELKSVPNDRLTEAIERLDQLHQLMAQSPGFIEAQIYRYLGTPGQYLVVRTWRDPDAHQEYRATPEAKKFGVGRSTVMPYKNLAVQHWDEVVRSLGSGNGEFLVRSLHNVGIGNDRAYLASRHQRDALVLEAGGVMDVRTYRPISGVDSLSQALVLERRRDRAGYDAYTESAASIDYESGVADTVYTTELIECYQLIQEVLPS